MELAKHDTGTNACIDYSCDGKGEAAWLPICVEGNAFERAGDLQESGLVFTKHFTVGACFVCLHN